LKINEDYSSEKKIIREKIKNLLNGLALEDHKSKSKIISDNLLKSDEYKAASAILIYYPFRKEIDTRHIIKDALKKNKKVSLPKISGSEIKFFFISDLKKDLKPGCFDIVEPDTFHCLEADLNSVDLIIVPGLCFDLNFNRIGYGKGFYDKILKKLSKKVNKIALAFDLQILKNIPAYSHDQKIDIIITESNIYKGCNIER